MSVEIIEKQTYAIKGFELVIQYNLLISIVTKS